jgi:hypothetical protein
MWASEIARTTEEKPAFENNKDNGSQQKSLVSTGYQMNILYSPHWWPDEHFFSCPYWWSDDNGWWYATIFQSPLATRWPWVFNSCLYISFSIFVSRYIEGRNCFVNDEVGYILSALLFQTNKIRRLVKQKRSTLTSTVFQDVMPCHLLGITSHGHLFALSQSSNPPFHKLHTIFPSWPTLAINMEAAQHNFLIYSSCAPDVMLS